MNILKKFQAIAICIALTLSVSAFSGCDDDDPNFPVTIGNTVFEERPEYVAVLSTNAADIVKFMGYTDRVVCISEDVAQDGFDTLPTCGSAIDPNVDTLFSNGVNAVIADDNLSDATLRVLEGRNIKVIQLHYYNDPSDVMTTYTSIGALFDGNNGKLKAQSAFNYFINVLNAYKESVDKQYKKKTLLYLSGTRNFTTVINGSWYNHVLDFTNTKVLSDKIKKPKISKTQISKYNPHYLVLSYKTEKYLKKSSMLKSLSALKSGCCLTIPQSKLKLQGKTAIDNIEKLVGFIDKDAVLTAKDKIKKLQASTTPVEIKTIAKDGNDDQITTQPVTVTQTETEPQSSETTKPKPTERYELQAKYKVKFNKTAIATMKKNAQNDYIKALQQRLFDLGYAKKDNVTGYFGEATEKSIKDFQNKNGLPTDGKVSDKLLQAVFSSDAV